MAKKTILLGEDLHAAVEAAAKVMESGGIAVFPTETVYGIGVVTGNSNALAKLRHLKKREENKPFQFLTADMDMACAMGAVFSDGAKKLAVNYWPGPMTLVVSDGTGSGTLGIRIPDSPFVLALCRKLGRPLITSSANPAGTPAPLDATGADAFGDEVDLLVDGGAIVGGVPSTVVLTTGEEYEILRHGGIDDADIESAWWE